MKSCSSSLQINNNYFYGINFIITEFSVCMSASVCVYVCLCRNKIIFMSFQSTIKCYVTLTLSTIFGLASQISSNLMILISSDDLAAKWRGV